MLPLRFVAAGQSVLPLCGQGCGGTVVASSRNLRLTHERLLRRQPSAASTHAADQAAGGQRFGPKAGCGNSCSCRPRVFTVTWARSAGSWRRKTTPGSTPTGAGNHGWEELPYWLKGFCNLGFVLRDEAMIAESQDLDRSGAEEPEAGRLVRPRQGSAGAPPRLKGRDDLWPNMIMLFCLQDYHEFTGDPARHRIDDPLLPLPEPACRMTSCCMGYWPKMRGGDLLLSVYWLYNRTGDAWLLELAHKVHQSTADWTERRHQLAQRQHVPGLRTTRPPTYMQSDAPEHLRASYRNFDKIRQMYGQVPGGMFGGDENCRPGFTDPRQAVETCGMVEMMLSTETLTWITGDLLWADRCEDVAFNSLPAALDRRPEGAALPDRAQHGPLRSAEQEPRAAERRADVAHEPARSTAAASTTGATAGRTTRSTCGSPRPTTAWPPSSIATARSRQGRRRHRR